MLSYQSRSMRYGFRAMHIRQHKETNARRQTYSVRRFLRTEEEDLTHKAVSFSMLQICYILYKLIVIRDGTVTFVFNLYIFLKNN